MRQSPQIRLLLQFIITNIMYHGKNDLPNRRSGDVGDIGESGKRERVFDNRQGTQISPQTQGINCPRLAMCNVLGLLAHCCTLSLCYLGAEMIITEI